METGSSPRVTKRTQLNVDDLPTFTKGRGPWLCDSIHSMGINIELRRMSLRVSLCHPKRDVLIGNTARVLTPKLPVPTVSTYLLAENSYM